jgi:hypothetical protein
MKSMMSIHQQVANSADFLGSQLLLRCLFYAQVARRGNTVEPDRSLWQISYGSL